MALSAIPIGIAKWSLYLDDNPEDKGSWDWIGETLIAQAASTLLPIVGIEWNFEEACRRFLLATIVGFHMTSERTYIYHAGDGVIAVNGEVTELGPFPDNAPPYLAYGLGKSPEEKEKFTLNASVLDTKDIDSLLIATDGVAHGKKNLLNSPDEPLPGKPNKVVGPFSQFWEDDKVFSNSDGLSRRLRLLQGKTVNRCAAVSSKGKVLATASGEGGDGTWLGALRGKSPLGNDLFATTDDGIIRLRVDSGEIVAVASFPDTEDFVESGDMILMSDEGIYVVGVSEIHLLTMKGE